MWVCCGLFIIVLHNFSTLRCKVHAINTPENMQQYIYAPASLPTKDVAESRTQFAHTTFLITNWILQSHFAYCVKNLCKFLYMPMGEADAPFPALHLVVPPAPLSHYLLHFYYGILLCAFVLQLHVAQQQQHQHHFVCILLLLLPQSCCWYTHKHMYTHLYIHESGVCQVIAKI